MKRTPAKRLKIPRCGSTNLRCENRPLDQGAAPTETRLSMLQPYIGGITARSWGGRLAEQ